MAVGIEIEVIACKAKTEAKTLSTKLVVICHIDIYWFLLWKAVLKNWWASLKPNYEKIENNTSKKNLYNILDKFRWGNWTLINRPELNAVIGISLKYQILHENFKGGYSDLCHPEHKNINCTIIEYFQTNKIMIKDNKPIPRY